MLLGSKLILIFSVILLITSCSGGGGGAPTPGGDEDYKPVHTGFNFEEPAHGFYNGHVLSDGRLIVEGVADTSTRRSLLSTGADTSSVTALTPNAINDGQFSASSNRAVYIDEGALFSKNTSAPVQLSGSEVVEIFWLSPDQTKVLYIANETYETVFNPTTNSNSSVQRNELYIVDVIGGNRVKLSIADTNSKVHYESRPDPLSPHKVRPQFLPDMSRVIYVVSVENTGNKELRSVLLNGSDGKTLNGNLRVDSLTSEDDEDDENFIYTFTPDSSHIIYGVTTGAIMELYSISPTGVGNTKISGTLVSGGSVFFGRSRFSAASSADSSYVVFLADADTIGFRELYRVAINGGTRVKLSNGTSVSTRPPLITADGSQLIYVSDAIYSVPTSGGDSTLMTDGFDLAIANNPVLTVDQTAVVYVANDRDPTTPKKRLYISKIDGSETLELSGTIIEAGEVHSGGSSSPYMMLDPSGGRVVFRADATVVSDYALYAVNLDGSGRVKLTPDRLHNRYTSSRMFGFSGSQFYFSYDRDFWTFNELYVYDFSNSSLVNVSASWPKAITEDVSTYSYNESADGEVQSFITDISAYREKSIVIANDTSSCRIELQSSERAVDGPSNFVVDSAGNHLYYTLRDSQNSSNWKFYKAATNDCSKLLISDGITEGLSRFKISPDHSLVAFSGSTNKLSGLHVAANDGSGAIELNANRSEGGIIRKNNGAFAFSHDSNRIVYWGDQDTVGMTELYSVTVDGVTTNKINGEILVTNGGVFDGDESFTPQLSLDNQWIVYKAQQDAAIWELYKSKLDGTENTKLSGTLVDANVENGNFSKVLKITADSSKVVYLVRDVSRNVDIYSVNLNGAPIPVKLNPSFSGVGRVSTYEDSRFRLTPDSQSVVYMTQDFDSAPAELFVSSLDGSTNTKLNMPLVEDGKVVNFNVTADGSKVVYHATAQNAEITELYVSNIDGSEKKLLSTPKTIRRSNGFAGPRLTADNRVVFRASINQVEGIYIMPLNGGTKELVFEIPDDRTIQAVHISNETQLRVIGDLRLQGVNEVFHFGI